MILLDDKEMKDVAEYRLAVDEVYLVQEGARVQAKKIALKLQAIYNLPDEGMFHRKMGEFIQELMGEVCVSR